MTEHDVPRGLLDDRIGLVIGGELTIQRRLAEGGMGAVFVALQASTSKERAVKLMHREIAADPDFLRRFEQEARVGARIRSEHVVEVLAAGVDGPTGLPYLVMELLEGEDLRHRLERGPLSVEDARGVLEHLCHAMTAAHAAGVVHRDLKPENVFLQRARRAGAGAFTVKVLDFGIAKLVLEASTRVTRGAVGSPLWMAPEQTSPGPVTAAADVWALGLIAYEMLVGRSFWRTANEPGGNTVQLLREIVLEPLPPASARAAEYGLAARLPPGFDAWFARCVRREPGERFPDAALLWQSLPTALASSAAVLADTGAALAATFRATPVNASASLDETGAATPFVENTPATPPPPRVAVRPETPLATVQEAPAAPAPRADRRVPVLTAALVVAVLVALAAVVRSRPPEAAAVPAATVMPPVASASVSASASASGSPSVSATAPAIASSVAPVAAASVSSTPRASLPSATASATPSAKPASPKPAAVGGFSDPSDRNGAVTWKVQDRPIRLFVRLVANESNVADAVVRRAIEHASWEYLRCYERVFGGAKEMPEGVVTVGFDILDQLPRHAKLVSSTIASDRFNECVVGTLVGRTINAAGPDGSGHAVEAFRFVPN